MVSVFSCDCRDFQYMRFPCRHIFAIRQLKKLSLFSKRLCDKRWTLDYYKNHQRALKYPSDDVIMDEIECARCDASNSDCHLNSDVLSVHEPILNVHNHIPDQVMTVDLQSIDLRKANQKIGRPKGSVQLDPIGLPKKKLNATDFEQKTDFQKALIVLNLVLSERKMRVIKNKIELVSLEDISIDQIQCFIYEKKRQVEIPRTVYEKRDLSTLTINCFH